MITLPAAATLAAVLALSPLACAAATIETATGPETIQSAPAVVAVYDIAALDTLVALGVPVAGVPDRVYLPELEGAAAHAEIVGTLFEPDLEALNALGPDLVIVGGRSSPQAGQTARVARSIDMTIDGTRLLEDARRRILDYGTLFRREDAAGALLSSLEAGVEAVRAAAEGRGDALIVMTNGPKISVFGPGSRFGWIHDELGIPAAASDVPSSSHGDAASFEFVAATDPDWLIVLDRAAAIGSGEDGARATLDNALIRSTAAWRNGNVIIVPAADLYIAAGGAHATARVLEALADGFSASR